MPASASKLGRFNAPAGQPTPLGTATIPSTIPGLDSDVLSGTITEFVPGDHLTLKLPEHITIVSNEAGITGGVHLWRILPR